MLYRKSATNRSMWSLYELATNQASWAWYRMLHVRKLRLIHRSLMSACVSVLCWYCSAAAAAAVKSPSCQFTVTMSLAVPIVGPLHCYNESVDLYYTRPIRKCRMIALKLQSVSSRQNQKSLPQGSIAICGSRINFELSISVENSIPNFIVFQNSTLSTIFSNDSYDTEINSRNCH